MFVISTCLFLIAVVSVQGFCGSSIKWSHNLDIEDVYGLWYGVGYAQHTPDMTNKPNEVGCVTLFIIDATTENHDDWFDWSIIKKNYNNQNWRSDKSNPWSDSSMAGSWLNVRLRRRVKRNYEYEERQLRVLWDEDGESLEQTYTYTASEPGLWVAEKRRPIEKAMSEKGVEIWYPDDPPRHPQVIRIIKLEPDTLILNHCSDLGDRGIFSLILKRSPKKIQRMEWYDYQRLFFNFDLPHIQRYFAICAGCTAKCSVFVIVVCLFMLFKLF